MLAQYFANTLEYAGDYKGYYTTSIEDKISAKKTKDYKRYQILCFKEKMTT